MSIIKLKIKKLFANGIFLWAAILLAASLLRFYGLDLNPVGLNHDDELHEIINSKSLALTGSHAPGRVAGILTQNDECPGNCVYGELGSYILIPWMLIFPLDMFWSKIPFALASVVIVFTVGKLFENLSKNTTIGMLAALFIAINPWSIHFGRTAYFTTFSYLFYLLGAFFFTRHHSYKSNLILGTLFSILASLFYFGTKPILPLIILWGIIYNLYQFKFHHLKFTLLLISIVVLLIGGYLFILSHSYAGRRLAEIGAGTPNSIKALVDQQRQVSLDIPLLRDIFINKYTVQAGIIIEKYLGFFSPTFLFLKGQGDTDNYYITSHGYYYLLDLPFLLFGIMAISTNLANALLILLLLAFSIAPAAIKITGDTIYSVRTGLAYPILSGIIAWGCYFCYSKISNLQHKYILTKNFSKTKLFLALVIILYVLSLTYFLVMYWYRTPFDKNIGWYFHKRVLSNYITRIQSQMDKKILVVTTQPDATFNTYIFYSGLYNNKNTIKKINNQYLLRNYEYDGAKFINDCKKITKQDLSENVILIERALNCEIDQKNALEIANPRDGGGMYAVINDSLCSNYLKNKYPYPRSIYNFRVETLANEDFCRMWLTNPSQ